MVRFFNDYNAHFKELMDFEYKKLDMINNDRIEELSNILSTEQALIMRTDTLEKKRLELMGDNKDCTFADIIAVAPVSCKARLIRSSSRMSLFFLFLPRAISAWSLRVCCLLNSSFISLLICSGVSFKSAIVATTSKIKLII